MTTTTSPGVDTTPTVAERAQALLDGGDRDDPTLPETERELRQIRGALRTAGFSEAQLAGRLGVGNLTLSTALTGQRPTEPRERLGLAVAVVEMLADQERGAGR